MLLLLLLFVIIVVAFTDSRSCFLLHLFFKIPLASPLDYCDERFVDTKVKGKMTM
jgi:hypothetical protein